MSAQKFTHYGLAEIHGPPSSNQPGAAPLWRVVMSAPSFGLKVHKDEKPAQQEDRIHSVRTLLLGEEVPRTGEANWRMPRLLSLHVVMGNEGDHSYDVDPAHDEGLHLHFARVGGGNGAMASIENILVDENPNHTKSVRAVKSVGRLPKSSDDAPNNSRGFHHIVAAPILDSEDWPFMDGEIRLPPLRLVEGTIELLVLKSMLDKFAPLANSDKEAFDAGGRPDAIRLRLTPDGIELPKGNALFPGQGSSNAALLAAPGPNGGVTFRLLPDQKKSFWLDHWRSTMPATDTEEEALPGFKIDARRSQPVPAFEWRPAVTSKVAPLPDYLFVPGSDIGFRIESPDDGTMVAMAELTPDYYKLAAARASDRSELAKLGAHALLLSAELEAAPHSMSALQGSEAATPVDTAEIAGMRLVSTAATSRLVAELVPDKGKKVDHLCGYDDVMLAAQLRSAQRGNDPATVDNSSQSADKDQAGEGKVEAPTADTSSGTPLSGYIPLDDGWLQLPVANLPPLDTSRDSELVGVAGPARPNVLSGFLRFAQSGERPPLLSAADGSVAQTIAIRQAPWSVTVLGARAARLEIILEPGSSGPLVAAAVHLADPELSTRGLLWLSSDRPSAREALPRLSAGPTAYLDLALGSKGKRSDGLAIAITAFHVSAGKKSGSLVRHALGLSIAPGTAAPPPASAWPRVGTSIAPILWQRHPVMPLAAAMPMTRSARSSVYPLESRDLVPFVVHSKPVWARLSWDANAVFPAIVGHDEKALQLQPHPAWKWPVPDRPKAKKKRSADAAEESPVDRGFKGVGLMAFGVPGWELRFDTETEEVVSDDPWAMLRSSLRFDIPGQDETFATATTPPVPGNSGSKSSDAAAAALIPTATSLDWPVLTAHWQEQERRVSIARVMASRADGMTSDQLLSPNLTNPTKVPDANVTTLIGDAIWATKLGFSPSDGTGMGLPYGDGWIEQKSSRGEEALRGLSGTITVQTNGGVNRNIELLGFSPVMPTEADWHVDNRRMGWKRAERSVGSPLDWRPLRPVDGETRAVGLATLAAPIAISWLPDSEPSFMFWMKDLAFLADGKAIVPGPHADFSAWSADRLPLSGAEWRLYPYDAREQVARFTRGRERIGFFGFELEPLRLVGVIADKGSDGERPESLAEIQILCRVHLGADTRITSSNDSLLTLKLTPGPAGWQASIEAEQLIFYLDSNAPGKSLRLTTKLSLAAGKEPQFDGSTIELSSRAMAHSGPARISASPTGVWISLDPPKAAAPEQSAIGLARLDAWIAPDDIADLSFRHEVQLSRASEVPGIKTAAVPFRASIDNGSQVCALLLGTTIEIKDKADAEFTEFDGAFGLRLSGRMDDGILTSRLGGTINVALAARLDGPPGLWLPLGAGLFDAGFASDPDDEADTFGHGVAITRFAAHAEAMQRTKAKDADRASSAEWTGRLEISGSIEIENAIAWPVLREAAAAERAVHLPESKSGRRKLGIKTDEASRRHRVTYLLDEHRLDLHLAERVARREKGAIWSAFVSADHRVGSGAAERRIVTTEAIAIGGAATLIQPFDDSADAVSFAGRYRDWITAQGKDSQKPAPGMRHTGIGTIATVFRGALGRPFREAFAETKETGLFLTGGALGLARDDENSVLLRLPVLAGLDTKTPFQGGNIQQRGDADLVVAWADGHAQRRIDGVWRNAATPATSSEEALEAALIAGSVTRWSHDEPGGRPLASALVDQHFTNQPMKSDALAKGVIGETAFFLGAAVTVDRLLALSPPKNGDAIEFLSLVAAPMPVKRPKKPDAIASLAAALRRPPPPSAVDGGKAKPPMLGIVGDDLVTLPWPADTTPLERVPPESIRRPAFQSHAMPRVALLRVRDPAGSSRYRLFEMPSRTRQRPATRPAAAEYPDSARGFPLGVSAGAWIRGSEQDAVSPLRDDDMAARVPSGAAGLSRRIDLPASSPDIGENSGDPSWYVQTRAPIYYSLRLTNLACDPIAWLRTVPARPRLPVADAIQNAWHAAKLSQVQPLIPEELVVTSTGDRSGVLTVRAAHIEAPAPSFAPDVNLSFDLENWRFGRPAQAGPVMVGTDRPPRPGPIPPNGHELYRRKRPCASPLFFTRPLDLIRGSADMMRGREGGGWTATFVAAPSWDGIVTDAWDGTIELAVEINVAAPGKDSVKELSPAAILKGLLGIEDTSRKIAAASRQKARARLLIGGGAIDYRRLFIRWIEAGATDIDAAGELAKNASDAVARRQRFTIWLDPSAGADRNPMVDAIGRAMAASETLPPVSLTLTLGGPGATGGLTPGPHNLHVDPTLDGVPQVILASGEQQLPTTLNFELFPLLRGRGALPLVSSSAIFVDQSYDDGLASEPETEGEPAIAIASGHPSLPENRGDLRFILAAESARAQIGGTLAILFDLRFEQRLDASVRAPGEGDMVATGKVEVDLRLQLQPASGTARDLLIGTAVASGEDAWVPARQPKLTLGRVHQLDLSRLVEIDGRPAEIVDGDILVLRAGRVVAEASSLPTLFPDIVLKELRSQSGIDLRIQLSAMPVVEPPPSTYAAMLHRDKRVAETNRLSLPLYALSPLPRRIDLVNALAGFRAGLIERCATFVWTLSRPRTELESVDGIRLHVVKEERNGQSHRPDGLDEMVQPRSIYHRIEDTVRNIVD